MPLWIKIILSIVVVEILGGSGAAITREQIPGWFEGLNKPLGNPPNWLFGPVWITLYAMMGAAFAIIWHQAEPSATKRTAMILFSIQLILNLAWTPVFFGMHQMLVALVVIICLWFTIALTIAQFWRLKPLAGFLLVPYLLWVSYATYLNGAYLMLNR